MNDYSEFESRYEPEPNTGCWLWTGTLNGHGYGTFKRKMYAHRLSWILHNGPIPEDPSYHGIVVRHRCHQRHCVNPDHLQLGTQGENIDDRERAGRNKLPTRQPTYEERPRGEEHGQAILDADQVRQIRTLHLSSHSYTEIGLMFGVSKSTAAAICSRRIWKHIQ